MYYNLKKSYFVILINSIVITFFILYKNYVVKFFSKSIIFVNITLLYYIILIFSINIIYNLYFCNLTLVHPFKYMRLFNYILVYVYTLFIFNQVYKFFCKINIKYINYNFFIYNFYLCWKPLFSRIFYYSKI